MYELIRLLWYACFDVLHGVCTKYILYAAQYLSIWIHLWWKRLKGFWVIYSHWFLSRLASQDKWFSMVLLWHKTFNFHRYIFWKAGCKWHIILHISDNFIPNFSVDNTTDKRYPLFSDNSVREDKFRPSRWRGSFCGGKSENLHRLNQENSKKWGKNNAVENSLIAKFHHRRK